MTRERILTIGGPGAGKSYTWMRLALFFKNSHFYIIDSELAAKGSLQEFPDISNVSIYEVVDWSDYIEALKAIAPLAKEGDWIVVDMMHRVWAAVQRHFISQVFDKDMGEYFLEARKKLKKDAKSLFAGRDAALKGWTDWPVINRLYEDFYFSLMFRLSPHLYMATAAQAVSEEDDREIKELFGPYGVKPAGQKDLGYSPDTVLLLAHTRDGYIMSTVKDRRGRHYFERQKVVNFPKQYGVIAKWF